MKQGTFIDKLDCYLVVESMDLKIKRIYFSKDTPEDNSAFAEEIRDYLEGHASCPQVELDLSECTDFQKRVYSLVQTIPRGKTMTYGEIADLTGSPRSARAVGRALAANPFVILVPCHRVVSKLGLGGFASGTEIKERLLNLEKNSEVLLQRQ